MQWHEQVPNSYNPYGNQPPNPMPPDPYSSYPNAMPPQQPQPPYGYDANQYQYNQPPPNPSYDYNTYNQNQYQYNQPPPPMQNYGPPPMDPSMPPQQYSGPPMGYDQQNYAPQPQYEPYQPVVYQPVLSTSRKKALLIGINYLKDPRCRLKGAINDAQRMKKLLIERFGFVDQPTSMVLLSDDQLDLWKQPTKANIITAMKWLVDDAQPGDSLFFHYSGHGSQAVEDRNGDESDGLDETICPVDFRSAGQIIDDDIHDIIVKPLPAGVRLTAVMDCCHSGTGMDLPYSFTATGTMNTLSHMHRDGHFGHRRHATSHPKESVADVILFSGCRDDQTSADTTVGLMSGGAMTNAFITAITKDPNSSYIQLLYAMRVYMNSGNRSYTQVPQLSSGRLMDMNQRISI